MAYLIARRANRAEMVHAPILVLEVIVIVLMGLMVRNVARRTDQIVYSVLLVLPVVAF